MKRFKNLMIATMIFLLAISVNTFAYEEIFLVVDGKKIEADAPAFIENDRTLVPIRFVSEALGYNVFWDNGERKVTIVKENAKDNESKKMELKIDKDKVFLYDNNDTKKETNLDVPAKIVKDRTFVPIRFVAENFGTKVDWDNDTKTVIIGDATKYDKEEITKLRKSNNIQSQNTNDNKLSKSIINNKTNYSNSTVKSETTKNNDNTSLFDKDTKDYTGRYVNLESGLYTLTIEKRGNEYFATAYRKEKNGEEQTISNVSLKMNSDGRSGIFISPEEQNIMNDNPVVFTENFLNFGDAKYVKASESSDVSYINGDYYINGQVVK